jgi:MinD-like ATPase involved in chromosome partitioning or flagellar assembly
VRIFIIDPDVESRANLLERTREAIRKLDMKRVELLDGDFDLIVSRVGEDPPVLTIFGPSCYANLERFVSRFRSFHRRALFCVVLENAVYAAEALDLRRFISGRLIPLADVAQIGQMILDACSLSAAGGTTANQGLFSFIQLKGGVGSSTLVTSFASSWAYHGYSVAILDLDDINPTITRWSQVKPEARHLMGEFIKAGKIPENRLAEICTAVAGYEGSLTVIGQPLLYRESFHLKAEILENAPSAVEFIEESLPHLLKAGDILLVDTGRSWGVSTFKFLSASEKIILVIDDDSSSMIATAENLHRLFRESDDTSEFQFAKWSIIINASGEGNLQEAEVRRRFEEIDLAFEGMPIFFIPSSEKGRNWTLSPAKTLYDLTTTEVREGFDQVASKLLPFHHAAAPTKQKENFFQNLFSRAKLSGNKQ